jgi:hypothetical protein
MAVKAFEESRHFELVLCAAHASLTKLIGSVWVIRQIDHSLSQSLGIMRVDKEGVIGMRIFWDASYTACDKGAAVSGSFQAD